MVDFGSLAQQADYTGVIQEWVGIILLTLLISFALPIVFVIALRYTEKYDRESWRDLLSSFIWGATVALVAVILIRGWFKVEFRTTFPMTYQYLAAIVVTPIVAELIKALGLFFNRDAISESEDGLIHGGTIGLGFAATENMLYGIFLFATYGFRFFVITMAVRSFSVVLINCVSTAIVCYGITRFTAKTHTQKTWFMFPLFYLGSVGISGTFNFFVLWGGRLFGTATVFSYSISLIFSIVLAVILAGFIYFKIYRLDRIDSKPKEQPPPTGGRPPPGHHPQPGRSQYRPPPARNRNVATSNVPRGPGGGARPPPRQAQRPPPRQAQRPPPRQAARPPPRRQQGSIGPQGPPRPLGPHNKPARRVQPKPQRPAARPARPSRPAPPKPAASRPAPSRASTSRPSKKSTFEVEEEDDFEFKPRSKSKSSGRKKQASFELEEKDDFEFKPRSKGKSSGRKKASMDWEEEDDDDDDWF